MPRHRRIMRALTSAIISARDDSAPRGHSGEIGIVIGLVLSAVTAPDDPGLLYGIHPFHPIVCFAVPLLLISVVMVGRYLLARRATQLDPMVSLRATEGLIIADQAQEQVHGAN
jgi:hypothetical protein